MRGSVAQWREQGFTVLRGFFDQHQVRAALKNVHRYAPTAREMHRTPERYAELIENTEAGKFEFPFAGDALNHLSTHPQLLDFVEEALGTESLLLSRACLWAKYAGGADYEQALHVDFEGNTLVVPREDGDYPQVNLIVYLSDVDARTGPTYVVPRPVTAGMSLWPPHRYRRDWPELYEHEQAITAKAGDVLVFGMSVFHRGSAIDKPRAARFTHHLVYRSARHHFAGYHLWSRFGEYEQLQHFIETTTPRQRHALGFPPPGDPYWTPATLAGVAERYPSMDLRPYRKNARRSIEV